MTSANSLTQDLEEIEFKSRIVQLILEGHAELALELLSHHYSVNQPEIRVGTVKGHRHVLACYVAKEKRIYMAKSEYLNAPFVVLHEFYHHLRASQIKGKRQVEKRADLFALGYIQDFRRTHLSAGYDRR
jgi:hypothetical protein